MVTLNLCRNLNKLAVIYILDCFALSPKKLEYDAKLNSLTEHLEKNFMLKIIYLIILFELLPLLNILRNIVYFIINPICYKLVHCRNKSLGYD